MRPRADSPPTPKPGKRTRSTPQSPNSIARRAARWKARWLRPRHDGYMAFQDAAASLLTGALQSGAGAKETIARINALYRASLAPRARQG